MNLVEIKDPDLRTVDKVRLQANRRLNPARKVELGQFMTPIGVARFMASLFSGRKEAVHLLDAGAGIGSLTDAFINRWVATVWPSRPTKWTRH
jgi:adenine-specific DNA-methyltransferase